MLLGTAIELDAGNHAFRGQRRQRLKLRQAGRAVGDARIFVNSFERREEPHFPFAIGPPSVPT